MTAHQVLGISGFASPAEIKAAYRRLAAQCHPDLPGGDANRMALINEAYRALRDGKTFLDSEMSAQERKRLKVGYMRELKVIEAKLRTVEATVASWSPADYRIPQMKEPLLAKKKGLEAKIAELA